MFEIDTLPSPKTRFTSPLPDCGPYIYGLVDPRNLDLRYVGVTAKLRRRYSDHCSGCTGNDDFKEWYRDLKDDGFLPSLVIIDTIDGSTDMALSSPEKEQTWIRKLSRYGCDLLNVNGNPQKEPSEGRPTKYDKPMTAKLVHLPDHLIEHAEKVGDGTLAEGVRKCIERDRERTSD